MSPLAALQTPEPAPAISRPARTIIYLGMDVHKHSITLVVLSGEAKSPTPLEQLANGLPKRRVQSALQPARACASAAIESLWEFIA